MSPEQQRKIDSLVKLINQKQAALQNLSNDVLRTRCQQIEHEIALSADKEKTLDNNLPVAYALLKEAARRLTLGDVSFTASERDRQFEKTGDYDFLAIKDGKAIYHNHWSVRGVDTTWDMVHYDEQIMGGILLHQRRAVEMATGEGKTLVATLPVFLNALTHNGVHVMTVNDYLSRRDYEITRPLYMMFGLTADCIENHPKKPMRAKAYRCDVVFGTNHSFTFDYLYDHIALSSTECVQRKHYYAIIDELDSILIDSANMPHIIGGHVLYDNEEIYKKQKPIIEELLAQGKDKFLVTDKERKKVTINDAGKQWLREKCGNDKLFTIQKTYEVNDYEKLPKAEQHKINQTLELQNVLYQLLSAYTVYEKDVDYIIDNKKIVIVDHNTGRPEPNCRWEYGLHTAVEAKEGVEIKLDHNMSAMISLKNYFKLYEKFAGMSGTLVQAKDELKEIYGLEVAKLPTHKPMIRVDKPVRLFKTEASKSLAVLGCIKQAHCAGRPVLVGCPSIAQSEKVAKMLEEKLIPHQLLNAKELTKEAQIISQAGEASKVTVSTSMAGRGTDIKLTAQARQNGGLVVIGTDIMDSDRVEMQLRGRAGRQGDPGTTLFFASIESPVFTYLTIKQRQELEDSVQNSESDELTNNKQAVLWLEIARKNREACLKNARKAVALKDDTIAPYREKFYNNRNHILFDSGAVDEVMQQMRITVADKNLMAHNLNTLYKQSKQLLVKEQSNNKVDDITYLPFSSEQRPFPIMLNIKQAIDSEAYFQAEFKRQVILLAFDNFWGQFVMHLSQQLDKKEIALLPTEFSQMMDKVNEMASARLTHATIPVGNSSDDDAQPEEHPGNKEMPTSETKTSSTKSRTELPADAPCPCGSGKKYGECHGRSRNTRHRRSH